MSSANTILTKQRLAKKTSFAAMMMMNANVPRELVKCRSNVLVKNWFRVVSVINGDV